MKVLCAFLAIAVAQAFAADTGILTAAPPITTGEIKQVVNDLDKGLAAANITLAPAEKEKLKDGLVKVANFKIEDHPEIMKAAKQLKNKIPAVKERICKFADKVDDKIPSMSGKVGLGIEKGFKKLGSEKFPAAIAKFKAIITDAAAKGARPDVISTLSAQADKIKECMAVHLDAIAAPLGNIIAKAGQSNKNAFSSLVTPFIDDCDEAKRR